MTAHREIERRLGEAYAQHLKENSPTSGAYQDAKEVIQSSLSVLEHYNKISLAMKGVFGKGNRAPVPAMATVPTH